MGAGAANPPKTKRKCVHEPWLDTAIDLSKVLTLDEKGVIHLNGVPIPNSQLVQLKADAQVMAKLPMWGMLVESMRQYAVNSGFNKSLDFESLKVAKGLLLILDTQKTWTELIAKAQLDRENVIQKS